MILKLVLCLLVLCISPILLGLLMTKFMKEKNNLLWAFVLGYLVQFASFQVIYLPCYFAGCSLKTLIYIWSSIIIILMILSIRLNAKRLREILNSNIMILRKMPKMILIYFILLAIQIYFPVMYMQHIDPDDAFYLGTTNTTIEDNSLFKINTYTGEPYQKTPYSYALSGLVIYCAAISELVNIHPTILFHTFWPAIAIILESCVYALIGNKLFKRDKEKLTYFLIFLAITYMFGFISTSTNFSFFAYRSWQGKALVANFIIPAVWLSYLYCMENEKKFIYWFIFLLLMISSCFVTEMGVFLVPIEVGVLSIISLVQERKIKTFLKTIICCLPQIIIGCIYLFH